MDIKMMQWDISTHGSLVDYYMQCECTWISNIRDFLRNAAQLFLIVTPACYAVILE